MKKLKSVFLIAILTLSLNGIAAAELPHEQPIPILYVENLDENIEESSG